MVRVEEYKELTAHKQIEEIPIPKYLYIPLSQHIGKPAVACVKAGDNVLKGQLIARSEGHISSCVHSSVSGVVKSVSDWFHPLLGRGEVIVIENDGLDRPEKFSVRGEDEVRRLTPDEIRAIVAEAGIVGMGGAAFPTHVKLNPPTAVSDLIINGAECEPYITCDNRLMIEKTEEIIKGIELVERCLGVKNVYFAVEDNKPEAIDRIKAALQSTNYRLKILKSQYPQGGEKQLIKSLLGKEVPSGKLPFDIGVVVHNVATVYAIYEALYINKPLYERVITVTGSCLGEPRNLLVRVGTPVREVIESCRPEGEFVKVIMGGPMMGVAQYSLDAPVIKSTSGILLLMDKEVRRKNEEFCIRCGQCIYNCPAGLMPTMINLVSLKGDWESAASYGVLDCIECGVCSYVCPANINLVQLIKVAKSFLMRRA